MYAHRQDGDVLEMAPIVSSEDGPSSYDYTEGASAIDIGNALDNNRRARRDSQYSADGDGAMFSGPGHSANPSSVSRMSHLELGRRSSDAWSQTRRKSFDLHSSHKKRRSSRGSQVSRQSVDMNQEESESLLSGDANEPSTVERRLRRRSISPPARSSVFENIAHIFGRPGPSDGGQRRSISQRSSMSHISRGSENALDTDDNEDERWGYSSGEGDSEDGSQHSLNVVGDNASITTSMEYDSDPPNPGEGSQSQSLPLLDFDLVFGSEARIDMDTTFTLLDLPPPGPPSRQTLYIPDEDNTIRFVGYETIQWRAWLWHASCILTLGILALVGHWFPYLWLRWVAREKAFIGGRNGFLVVEVSPPIS
jgi:cation-transporting ATPase 13A2